MGTGESVVVSPPVLSGWLLRILYEISDEKRVGK